MLRKLYFFLLPPAFFWCVEKFKERINFIKPSLFDGDDELFKANIRDESIYFEYGCGASTLWVANNHKCRIYSVDSSPVWVDKVKKDIGGLGGINVHWADVGKVGPWGTPTGYQKNDNFPDYTDWLWSQGVQPDIVLIDGRFRVCCFLTSLLYAERGVKIFFDDYKNRPEYHYVEKYLKPINECGRQAMFVVPEKEKLLIDCTQKDIEYFRFVFD
jgi:hypothetical protein